MQDTDQFARLLHIQQPWRVSLVEVDEKDLTVTVHVGIDDDLELECPLCNARSPRYDRRRRTWRHLDTMEFSTFVTAQVPRINCPTHGVRQLRVPWAEDSSRYTLAFESFVIDRTVESIETYFTELTSEDCARIESVTMDMWPAYIATVSRYVPNVAERICFDKFHIAKYVGDAVDKVRREEHRTLSPAGYDWLKGTKHRWLQNPSTMSRAHWRSFEELRRSTLKTARAWSLKECAMMLWHYSSRTWARKQWSKWITAALRSRLEPMRHAAATIRRHLDGIFNAVVLKKTNAIAESVNSKIQRLKYRACGYRNRESFRTAIMFYCGKLDLYPRLSGC